MGIHPGEVQLIARASEVPRGSLDELQQAIGIAFRDITLLQEALTHSSFANESPHISPRDNERLEYLGDAVLQLITAEYLYKLRPEANEGELTQVRSAMVNTNTLASLSEELGIGHYLHLGKGIAKGGGRNLKSLLANAFEAVLGAVFLDAGYDAAYHYYLDRFRSLPEPIQDENHKGRLQQVVQERFGQTPYYDSAASRAGRGREYTAVVFAGAEPLGTGHAGTKQAAEQEAARQALDSLLGAGAVPAAALAAAAETPESAPRPRSRSRRQPPKPLAPAEAPALALEAPALALEEEAPLPTLEAASAATLIAAPDVETVPYLTPAPEGPVLAPAAPIQASPSPPAADPAPPPIRRAEPPRHEFGAMPSEPAPASVQPSVPPAAPAAEILPRPRTSRRRAPAATADGRPAPRRRNRPQPPSSGGDPPTGGR